MTDSIGCVGPTIKTCSGLYFDFMNPTVDMIVLEDIAAGLSKICRFGGQSPRFYSVAEHCSVAAMFAFRRGDYIDFCRAVLLHDASEAFAGDIVRPLKLLLGKAYTDIEHRIQKVIGEKFGVDFELHHAEIKKIDNAMLFAEKREIFPEAIEKWSGEDEIPSIDVSIFFEDPDTAYETFMNMANCLGIK